MAFLHAGGTIVEKKPNGEKLKVDTGCIVAFSGTSITALNVLVLSSLCYLAVKVYSLRHFKVLERFIFSRFRLVDSLIESSVMLHHKRSI